MLFPTLGYLIEILRRKSQETETDKPQIRSSLWLRKVILVLGQNILRERQTPGQGKGSSSHPHWDPPNHTVPNNWGRQTEWQWGPLCDLVEPFSSQISVSQKEYGSSTSLLVHAFLLSVNSMATHKKTPPHFKGHTRKATLISEWRW